MNKDDSFVSLRRDMGHVLWSGLSLHQEVDVRFVMERRSSTRLIRAYMTRPGHSIDLNTLRELSIAALSSDYANLETEGAEMMVVARHIGRARASVVENCIELVLELPEQPQHFLLNAGIEGRWDWFLNPRELPDPLVALSLSRRVGDMSQVVA